MNPIGKKFDAVIPTPDLSTRVISDDSIGVGLASHAFNTTHVDVFSADPDYGTLLQHDVERTPTGTVVSESWSLSRADGLHQELRDDDGDGTIDSASVWNPADAIHPNGQSIGRNDTNGLDALQDFPVLKAPIRG